MYRVIGGTESFLTIFARVVAKEKGEALRQETFAWALSWLEEEGASKYTGNNRLVRVIFHFYPNRFVTNRTHRTPHILYSTLLLLIPRI